MFYHDIIEVRSILIGRKGCRIMPMTREEHEEILNSLLDQSIEHSQRTELLQKLRADYSQVLTDDETYKQKIEKLQKDNDDLIVSNSKLFHQIGIE